MESKIIGTTTMSLGIVSPRRKSFLSYTSQNENKHGNSNHGGERERIMIMIIIRIFIIMTKHKQHIHDPELGLPGYQL